MPDRNPGLLRNPLVIAGAILALTSLVNLLFLLLTDIFAIRERPYFGLFAYLALPGVLGLGLLLLAGGWLYERTRRRPAGAPAFPAVDFNLPGHRRAVAALVGVVAFFLTLTLVGSYQFYQFTDSVTFCGQACHAVMNPQFTAYQDSPHARVRCTECHIGSGATGYVHSKLAGMKQAYALVLGRYARPIPTPVKSMRPAQETCERCHWPEKFWGDQLLEITHFASDDRNTRRVLRMLVKIGGGSPTTGQAAGIHWHMNLANEVRYIAKDPRRQEILWVQAKDRQGRLTEYLAGDAKLTPEQIARAEKRRMDCMDCHDRPSHIFQPPDRAVDQSLLARRLDDSLPFIKREAVKVLAASYPSTAAAREGIATALDAFYLTQYPALYQKKRETIRATIAEVQRLYARNIFPEMKVDWRTHPDNIGHFRFPGCFRCHDGRHVSREGKVIRNECGICHVTIAQSVAGKPLPIKEGGFEHPVDVGDLSAARCSDCHSGGSSP